MRMVAVCLLLAGCRSTPLVDPAVDPNHLITHALPSPVNVRVWCWFSWCVNAVTPSIAPGQTMRLYCVLSNCRIDPALLNTTKPEGDP